MAYILLDNLRRIALQTTDLADARCGTICSNVFKIGALVSISVRRIELGLASGCPYGAAFATVHIGAGAKPGSRLRAPGA